MSEASAHQRFDLAEFEGVRLELPVLRDNRRFRLCLLVVALCHVLLLITFNAARPRRIGDPRGVEEAISVSFVTEADLAARATVEDKAAGKPSPPPGSALTAPQADDPPLPPDPQVPPPEPQAQPPEPQAQPPAEGAAPQPARDPSPSSPQPKSQQARTAKLDLTLPPAPLAAPSGGGGAGVERPPGITRSGENDAFARGVIRALQQTMPQLSDTLGRVTVRITLDRNGALLNTQVVSPSKVAGLDQSVVFATKQTSFPFPPKNANAADLIFVVTYVYR